MSFPRYPKYKNSGVEWLGEVPEHWKTTRLKHTSHVFPSNVDKKSYEGETPVRLCNYTDVYYNCAITPAIEFMPATASPKQIERFTLCADDVILTKDSETADDIAIATYVPEDLPGVVCGYHLAIVRPTEGYSGAFIKRLFDSSYVKSRVAVLAKGLTRVGLGQFELDNIELSFPPRAEQCLIAKFIDREALKIDALIAEQQQLIELLKEKRQAVISNAVTKGLNPDASLEPSGSEWLGDVPTHWQVKPLRAVASVVRGASPRPAGDPRLFAGNAVPWVTVAEITKDESTYLDATQTFLTAEGAEQSRLFPKGTVVYSNSGATLGVPKILRIDACANDGVVGFLNLHRDVIPEFLYHLLASITTHIREKVKQGSGQPNLNTDIVKALRLACPPEIEQQLIVNRISALYAKFAGLIAASEQTITLLRERRASLISAAVTGKIDVRRVSSAEAA